MFKGRWCERFVCLFTIIIFCSSVVLAYAADATNVPSPSPTSKQFRCYGTSYPASFSSNTNDVTYVGCGGSTPQCPQQMVPVGVFIQPTYYKIPLGWFSINVVIEVQCTIACAKLTTYSPLSNCIWE